MGVIYEPTVGLPDSLDATFSPADLRRVSVGAELARDDGGP